jgi:hypothetical protein
VWIHAAICRAAGEVLTRFSTASRNQPVVQVERNAHGRTGSYCHRQTPTRRSKRAGEAFLQDLHADSALVRHGAAAAARGCVHSCLDWLIIVISKEARPIISNDRYWFSWLGNNLSPYLSLPRTFMQWSPVIARSAGDLFQQGRIKRGRRRTT